LSCVTDAEVLVLEVLLFEGDGRVTEMFSDEDDDAVGTAWLQDSVTRCEWLSEASVVLLNVVGIVALRELLLATERVAVKDCVTVKDIECEAEKLPD
jgi:hypothetical protein